MVEVLVQLCEQESTLRTFKIIYLCLNVIRILVPIIIIVMGAKDMMNVALSGKEDEMKIASKQLIRRIIAGFVVFLIPTAINAIFSLSAEYEEKPSEFNGCSVCLTNGKECDLLMAVAREQKQLEEEKQREKYKYSYVLTPEDIENYRKAVEKAKTKKTKTVEEENPHGTKSTGTVSVTKYFNSQNVTQISGLSEQELISILENSSAFKGKAKIYVPYAKDLIAAEKNHGVNAFYLIGVYSLESGWMGSNLAKECNNLGGVRFYHPYQLSSGKYTYDCRSGWAGFDSKSDFIDYHAGLLERAYLTPGASHHYGYSVANVAKDYGHSDGVDTIIQIATKLSS